LGLCCWFFIFDGYSWGTSFFGNPVGYATSIDSPANAYTSPTFTFSGVGGSDIMTFPQAGVYILFPVITCLYGGPLNEVAIIFDSTLTDVTVNNDSINDGTIPVSNYTLSFANITSGVDGSITFPPSSELTSMYGVNWSNSICKMMLVHRLS